MATTRYVFGNTLVSKLGQFFVKDEEGVRLGDDNIKLRFNGITTLLFRNWDLIFFFVKGESMVRELGLDVEMNEVERYECCC